MSKKEFRGLKFWRDQFNAKTTYSRELLEAWEGPETRKEIAKRFETTIGILCGLRSEGYLEQRLPGIRRSVEKEINYLKVKETKKDKETILAEQIWRQIEKEKPIPELPKLVNIPKIEQRVGTGKEETQILLLSDCHPGVKTKSFNTEVYRQRIRNLIYGILKISGLHKQLYPIYDLEIFFLGDGPNGERVGKTVNLDEIECSVYHQIINHFVPSMVELLTNVASHFRTIRVSVVPGNHGQPLGRDSAYSTNWDLIAWEIVKIQVSSIENIVIDIETASSYKIVNVRDHYFVLTHGDGIPIHLTLPFYGMSTRGLRMHAIEGLKIDLISNIIDSVVSNEINREKAIRMLTSVPFSCFCTGHFHVANKFNFNGIRFITNGSFKTDDEYVMKKMGMGNLPCQVTFGVSDKRVNTWYYEINLDKP